MIDHVSHHQVECLSRAVFSEARGEPLEGQVLVAQVIKNRVLSKQYADTYCDVIKERGQFTFTFNQQAYEKEAGSRDLSRKIAKAIAYYDRFVPDTLMYFNKSTLKPFDKRFNVRRYRTVGAHTFYTLKKENTNGK